MKEKGKFKTLILSFIPGLSHLYLGFGDRAVIFFMVFFGAILGVTGLAFITGSGELFIILIFALPVIWLIALVDAFSLRKKYILNEYANSNSQVQHENIDEVKESNKKTIAMALSIIPGAGHMYLGYQKKGLALMGGFFFTIFFMGWMNSGFFLFVLPLIWFYSFFDALHSLNGEDFEKEEISSILPNVKPEWVGYILIIIGILIVVERILYPLISYELRNYIQTSIVSLIFIIGGIKLLAKGKKEEDQGDGDEICKKDE